MPNGSKYNLPFELRPADLLQLASMIIFLCVFIDRTDRRINALERTTEYLASAAEAADNYNSSVWGTRFKGGAPIDGAFRQTGNRGFAADTPTTRIGP